MIVLRLEMDINIRQQEILDIVKNNIISSRLEIKEQLSQDISMPTLNRDLAYLVDKNYLIKQGKGRSISYSLSPFYTLFAPYETSEYFDIDPDARDAKTTFNFDLLPLLKDTDLLEPSEKEMLEELKIKYQENIKNYPQNLYQKELERLTIELSWKSAQIEGNTYSLLETELLFKEKEEAKGKPKEDAIMLLNHKKALDYILLHKDLADTINLKSIEEIHSLLIGDLNVSRNIRTRTVGIVGSAYKPIDNEHQIKENIEAMCEAINQKDNGFEKALLAIALISYIQPFEDGNKRTARMVSNALLINYGACPLSYRSTDALEYKKAMLLFYEQNNLRAFKDIFIQQNIFSAKNYFQ